MSANFQTLRPLILAKLLSVSQLETAYDIHTENTIGYPYATFEPTGSTNSYYTNTDNLREYSFDIIVYQEMTVATRDNAMEILGIAIDAIITAFDTDTTLRVSGGAHYVNALPSEWGEYSSKAGPIKYGKLRLQIGVEIGVV